MSIKDPSLTPSAPLPRTPSDESLPKSTLTKYLLLLGEGNFSFAAALSKALLRKVPKHVSLPPPPKDEYIPDESAGFSSSASDVRIDHCQWRIIATDVNEDFLSSKYKNAHQVEMMDKMTRNISTIQEAGGFVFLDVNATMLQDHTQLKCHKGQISKIIFNFPHAKTQKMKIHLNRRLLRDFFQSAKEFLKELDPEVQLCVTLRAGQSGINGIENNEKIKPRCLADSWQIMEMAAAGSFVLKNALPFDDFCSKLSKKSNLAKFYESCGYRNGPTSFLLECATTFIFVQRKEPEECFKAKDVDESVEALLANRVFEMESIIASLGDKHPLVNFVISCFNLYDSIKLRLNSTDSGDTPFGAWFAVSWWVEGIKCKYTWLKLCKLIGPSIDPADVLLLNEEDETGRLIIVFKGITLGLVYHLGGGDLEEWEINVSSFLSLCNENVDWRYMFSEYSQHKGEATIVNFLQGDFTTGSYHPREKTFDISFWTAAHHICNKDPESPDHHNPSVIHTNVKKIAFLVFGPLLKTLTKREGPYFPKEGQLDKSYRSCDNCKEQLQRVSYLFRLVIQSLDRPLSDSVMNSFKTKFQESLTLFLEAEVR